MNKATKLFFAFHILVAIVGFAFSAVASEQSLLLSGIFFGLSSFALLGAYGLYLKKPWVYSIIVLMWSISSLLMSCAFFAILKDYFAGLTSWASGALSYFIGGLAICLSALFVSLYFKFKTNSAQI